MSPTTTRGGLPGIPAIYFGLMVFAFLRRRVLPFLALLGCSKWTEPPAIPVAELGDGGAVDCRSVVLRVDSVGLRRSVAPPSRAVAKGLPVGGVPTTYVFDVTLRNPANGPRWILLPGAFTYDGKDTPAPGKGGVMTLRADVLRGRGRVVVVRAGGPGSFQAVLLPAHTQILLHNVAVESWWTTSHATAKIEAILARDFTIDGAPITSWLTGDPVSEGDGEVSVTDDARNELPAKPLTPDTHHSVTFDEECRGTGQAILKKDEL